MRLLLTLISLFLAMALLFTGNGLFMNSISAKLNFMGMSSIVIGLVNSSFFIGATLSSSSAHLIIARVGFIRSFTVCSSLMCIGVLLHSLTDSIVAMVILRIMQGYGYYGVLMVIESWLNEKSDTSIRSRILASYETVFYSASAIGALLMGLNLASTTTFVLSAIFICMAIIPIGLTKIRAPELQMPTRISIPRIFDVTPLAILGSFTGGIFVSGFITMAPVFILQHGFSVKQASLFITSAMLGGFLIQLPIGKISDTFSRRLAIILVTALSFLAAVGMLYVSNAYVLYVLGFFLGSGCFPLYALSLARANDRFSTNHNIDIVEIGRSLLFTYGLASLFSPLLFGLSMYFLGSRGFNVIYIVFSLFLLVFSFTRIVVPKEERGIYVAVPASATAALTQLDPRTELGSAEDSTAAKTNASQTS